MRGVHTRLACYIQIIGWKISVVDSPWMCESKSESDDVNKNDNNSKLVLY